MARRKDSSAIESFHRAALQHTLAFLRARGICTVEMLNAVDGKKLITESLYKILEAPSGKYGGDFISEGVKLLEDRLGKRVGASTGRWPEASLIASLGPARDEVRWQERPEYRCEHEHVNEMGQICRLLVERPETLENVLDACLIGCVVLASEHRRLPTMPMDSADPWRRYRGVLRVWSRVGKRWVV